MRTRKRGHQIRASVLLLATLGFMGPHLGAAQQPDRSALREQVRTLGQGIQEIYLGQPGPILPSPTTAEPHAIESGPSPSRPYLREQLRSLGQLSQGDPVPSPLGGPGQTTWETGRFLFIYAPQDGAQVQTLATLLTGVFSDLEGAFGRFPWPRLPVVLHPYAEYRSRFGAESDAHYTPGERTIHIGFATTSGRSSTDVRMEAYVIHEATHAFQHALTGLPPYAGTPPWFAEGLARYCERRFVRQSPFPKVTAPRRDLTPLEANPYENGYEALAYLINRGGVGSVAQLFSRIANGTPFAQAFPDTYSLTIPELQATLRNR